MTRCTVQLLACRQTETIQAALGEDGQITQQGHILIIGTPLAADKLQAELLALSQREDRPYVVLPEGLQEMARQLQIPYVTYGDNGHVQSHGQVVETPLGTAVLADTPGPETLAGLAAALLLRVDLATAAHRLNARPRVATTAAA